jgi:hypothetical protein
MGPSAESRRFVSGAKAEACGKRAGMLGYRGANRKGFHGSARMVASPGETLHGFSSLNRSAHPERSVNRVGISHLPGHRPPAPAVG